jgi:hypothetical protein
MHASILVQGGHIIAGVISRMRTHTRTPVRCPWGHHCQADVSSALRRLAALEGATSSAARDSRELAAAVTRLAARGADADGRGAELAAQVSGVAALLPGVAARVAVAEGHLGCSLRVAKQGLDILADQLVALGALNARRAGSPSKNPLAGESDAACAVLCHGGGGGGVLLMPT